MKRTSIISLGLAAIVFMVLTTAVMAGSDRPGRSTLAGVVREVTTPFKDVKAAEAAGYGLFHGCTSGPQGGAMGLHYANGALVGDGEVNAQQPEVLLYEPKDGKLQLAGVEYLVPAEAWDAKHDAPPVLMGQLFNYVGAPNRYGLSPLYELHVWAWRGNPDGTFADWNPRVSCDSFVGDTETHTAEH